MTYFTGLVIFSGFSFLGYGFSCLFSKSMKSEFNRFGLERFRKLTGALEVLGGMGILIGISIPIAMKFSSGGLTLLMLFGLGVRIKMKDTLLQATQALALMAINLYIFVKCFNF
jgi:hypothetical protein